MDIINLNFSDLNEDTKEYLIRRAIKDIEIEYGKEELIGEAEDIGIDYEEYISEKAEEKLYEYTYEFNI